MIRFMHNSGKKHVEKTRGVSFLTQIYGAAVGTIFVNIKR